MLKISKKAAFISGLEELICLADEFDKKGLFAQANKLDKIIASFSAYGSAVPGELVNELSPINNFSEYLEKFLNNNKTFVNSCSNINKFKLDDAEDAQFLNNLVISTAGTLISELKNNQQL